MIPADQINAAADSGIRAWLASYGYTPGPSTPFPRLLTQAHNVRYRTLPTRKWTVHWTRDLKGSRVYAINRHAMNALVEKAEKGLPLYPHQSTGLDDIEANDGLLTDWGIQHLHLDTAAHAKKPRYVQRADYILFAYPYGDHLILLDILRHPHGDGWADEQLINLLHRDYPKVLERHLARGITGMETPITQDLRHKLRTGVKPKPGVLGAPARVMLTQVADGTLYYPPGGGPAANGRPWILRKAADMTLEVLKPESVRANVLTNNPDVPDEPPVSMSITFTDDLRVQLSASWKATKVELPEWPERAGAQDADE